MIESAARSDAILQRLLALHPKKIDLKLDRILRLLADLGNPQDRLPPVWPAPACLIQRRTLRR